MRRAQSFASLSAGTICELKKTSSPEYREIAGAWSEAPYFIGDRAHSRRPFRNGAWLPSIYLAQCHFPTTGYLKHCRNYSKHCFRMAERFGHNS